MTDLFSSEDKSDYSSYLPGEASRYKTIEDLAKGKQESDIHIKRIEQENADLRSSNLQLREDNNAKAKLEEYLDQITKAQSRTLEGTNPKPADAQMFDPKQFEPHMRKYMQEYEATKTREQNSKTVVDALKERYGQNYM